jgi:hypothetical protein
MIEYEKDQEEDILHTGRCAFLHRLFGDDGISFHRPESRTKRHRLVGKLCSARAAAFFYLRQFHDGDGTSSADGQDL